MEHNIIVIKLWFNPIRRLTYTTQAEFTRIQLSDMQSNKHIIFFYDEDNSDKNQYVQIELNHE